MNTSEVLEFASELVFDATGTHLSDLQRTILQGCLENYRYEDIAESIDYSSSHVRGAGASLWKLLSQVLGTKVTKTNFRSVLEARQRSRSNHPSQLDSPLETNPEPSSELVQQTPETFRDPGFIGREAAIADLNHLVQQGASMILIHGAGGVGKSKLAWRYLATQGFDIILELWMAKETDQITSAEAVVEEWLERYLNEQAGREFGISLDRLKQRLRDPAQRIGVLIDNLEPALDSNGKFIPRHRAYVELLRVLVAPEVRSLTLVTSRERLRESAVSLSVYSLSGLSEADWRYFFQSRGLVIDENLLHMLHTIYAGNAKAMEILAGIVQSDYQGTLTSTSRAIDLTDFTLEGDLEDLVSSQFDRLEQLVPDAHQLLCRLGCYRYQDVPAIPVEAISCLLWDMPRSQHKGIIKALKDRSLLECDQDVYWLHPAIQAEALRRLRTSHEWVKANLKAADFWTHQVEAIETREDATRALEAYFHYEAVDQFDLAAEVITKERQNKWVTTAPLGKSFYRLGLLQHPIHILNTLVNQVIHDEALAKLTNILGDLYWLAGKPSDAIQCHQKSKAFALSSNLERYYRIAIFNTAVCQIDLWEISQAIESFEIISAFGNPVREATDIAYAWCCLAFLYSHKAETEKAVSFVQKFLHSLPEIAEADEAAMGYGLFYLGRTYNNLGETGQAFEMYQRAIAHAEESHFIQIKAKSLTGLAELYRQKKRFQKASSCHTESLNLLNKIGAQSDLAEAYLQSGLTYKMMGQAAKSEECRHRAIQLFTAMQAPKQLERVKQLYSRSLS